jgi:Ca2+-binding EF-hand superfamily protein
MSLKLNDKNRETIRQVFNLKANKDGRLDKEALAEIFEMIGYELSPEELTEIQNMLFEKRETIGFRDFLDLFKLRLNDLTKDDIKSAFKVLARDNDEYIPLN